MPCGPGGEDQVGHVGGGDRRRAAGGDVGLAVRSPGQERLPPDRPGAGRGRRFGSLSVRAQDDHQVEVGQCLAADDGLVEQGRVIGAEEPLHGQEDPGSRRPQDVRRLGSLVAGVQRHEHRAGADRAQGRDDPLRAVRRPDGDAVAGVDAVGHHRPGGRRHLLGQSVEGPARRRAARSVAIDHGLGVAEAGRGVLDQAGEGPPLEVASGIGHI